MCKFDYFKKFRTNLQLLRVSKGFTAEELAEIIGISKKRITDFEYGKYGRGKPKAEELFKLSQIFGVTSEDLIFKDATVTFK